MEESHASCWNLVEPGRGQVTIDMLPDLALLEIFDFYVAESQASNHLFSDRVTWIALVHVCRKWRDIVFASPRRLNLLLFVTPTRSSKKMLDTWPPLLIDIWGFELRRGIDTIIAALEHDDRIRQIELFDSSSFHMDQAFAAMRKPFPELIGLTLSFFDEDPDQVTWPVIPDSFLGESVPRLQSLRLIRIPFPVPVLRKLLLSATDLVKIRIWNPPNSWYISPEEIVTCLSTLTRLEVFELGFQSRDNWGGGRLPPSTRYVFPALTSLQYKGVYGYMEDLLARIDAPQLEYLKLFLFYQRVLDAPQLVQFIGRTPRFKALNESHIFFHGLGIFISLPLTLRRGIHFGLIRRRPDQLSSLVKLCTSSFLRTLIPIVEHLYILEHGSLLRDGSGWEDNQWREILHPFTAVKNLYLSKRVAPTLYGSVGEGTTEVLPALRNLFLPRLPSPGLFGEIVRQFVAARQLSSHQIAISYWDGEFDEWLEWLELGDAL